MPTFSSSFVVNSCSTPAARARSICDELQRRRDAPAAERPLHRRQHVLPDRRRRASASHARVADGLPVDERDDKRLRHRSWALEVVGVPTLERRLLVLLARSARQFGRDLAVDRVRSANQIRPLRDRDDLDTGRRLARCVDSGKLEDDLELTLSRLRTHAASRSAETLRRLRGPAPRARSFRSCAHARKRRRRGRCRCPGHGAPAALAPSSTGCRGSTMADRLRSQPARRRGRRGSTRSPCPSAAHGSAPRP